MPPTREEELHSIQVEDVTTIKGIPYPADVRFRQLIITGPPGSGKTRLVETLGGWPGEGYLDLAKKKWWTDASLNYRPREVHLGLPFVGFTESHAVFDKEWLIAPAPVDEARILLPPHKRRFWSTDWYKKYVFEFQLIPAAHLYEIRKKRAHRGSHPVDAALTLEGVQHQVAVHEAAALHLHRCGMRVFFRTTYEGPPRRFL